MIDGKKKSYTLYQLKEIDRPFNPTLVRSYQTSKSSEDEEEEVSSGVDNARLVCGSKWVSMKVVVVVFAPMSYDRW